MNISKQIFATTAVVALALASAGCATQMLSDNRIAEHTAGVLGVPPNDVLILKRTSEATETYYTARTSKGEFQCHINGGGVLAVGMVNPPVCTKQ